MKNIEFGLEQQEKYGCNVEILLKFMRHGERDKEGNLLDLGRTLTAEKAKLSGLSPEDFDAVKAIGSNAGPKNEQGFGRAMETAAIYAQEVAGDEVFNSRINKQLSYEGLVNPLPFDHKEVYDSLLPDNFNDLPESDKIKASKTAQAAEINLLFKLKTEAAEKYKRETAGAAAYVIGHYQEMAKRLNSESKVLIPAGSHGGLMEFLLQQALIRKDNDSKEKIGLESIEEIGGEFDPSDSYNIDIRTDDKGELQALEVSFDNHNRPQGKMSLDKNKLTELAEDYKKLHNLE